MSLSNHSHEHVFLGEGHGRNEKRTWLVIALTATMMVVEITAGSVYGSMALVADGWHMATHVAAMLIAALAYLYSRRHRHNQRFTFGTGKMGDLAGFASAIVLALIALGIGWESAVRLTAPIPINFHQAIIVAVIGLAVNVASALLLREDHDHGHGHDHGGHDNNLRAAYLHVMADALTSVLAIVALVAGSYYGWLWPDPVMGIVGGLVIARWSFGLIRDAGGVLLDYVPAEEDLPEEIRSAIETDGDRIVDLHVWQLGPGHHGAIISIMSQEPQPPAHYKGKVAHIHDLSHVTFEIAAA
jgi:cation diffusion facilitator family transporter